VEQAARERAENETREQEGKLRERERERDEYDGHSTEVCSKVLYILP
jgi:hypothetical protein